MRILAAIDNSAAARPVLDVAHVLAGIFEAEVSALHVKENGARTAEGMASAANVPLRILKGKPASAVIADASEDEDVIATVIGARREASTSWPAGHTAMMVAEQSSKPTVVVPPEARTTRQGGLARLLVALDGTEATANAVLPMLPAFSRSNVDIVALHVFAGRALPRFWDRPEHDVAVWTKEFLARHEVLSGARLEIRAGRPGAEIVKLAAIEQVDLIVLGRWTEVSAGEASVANQVVARAVAPVLLCPITL